MLYRFTEELNSSTSYMEGGIIQPKTSPVLYKESRSTC